MRPETQKDTGAILCMNAFLCKKRISLVFLITNVNIFLNEEKSNYSTNQRLLHKAKNRKPNRKPKPTFFTNRNRLFYKPKTKSVCNSKTAHAYI